MAAPATEQRWPALPLESWRDSYATLHMWTQMVGKTKLALAPPENHWWHVALHPTARGLTTGPLVSGRYTFDVEFDFVGHELVIRRHDGPIRLLALEACSVADFYRKYCTALEDLGLSVSLRPLPCEVEDPIPFSEDRDHAAYDRDLVHRWWRIMSMSHEVFRTFRGEFLGKSSPSHFFWGSFDLAVTRFSGRRAPERADADAITREGYSHEVISAGFWPGSGQVQQPAFYAYAAPEPLGFHDTVVSPPGAFYHPTMGEFILPYDVVRASGDPPALIRDFLRSTYAAAADLARWDRSGLERSPSAR